MSDADRIAAFEAENAALKTDIERLQAEIMALEEDEAELLNQVANRDARIANQRTEILRLQVYAPGRRAAHEIRMAPHVGPTNAEYYGIKLETDEELADWGRPVQNTSEA